MLARKQEEIQDLLESFNGLTLQTGNEARLLKM